MNLRDIFAEAIQIENARDRQNYLQRACGSDQALRTQLEQLLADHANLGNFLESESVDSSTITRDHNPKGEHPLLSSIGPYRLLEEIGSGGMGIVYLAHQSKPVDRRVALKIIKPGMDTRQVLARFEAERQALALMDHPNIAKVLDAGQTDSGSPYFVMELVNGIPITEFCDQHHLTTRERLELFIPVCMAIQHAHQKGVIHRDLKPSNILVTLYDDKPVPKVIDFGIAKATHQRLTDLTLYTAFGHIVGTFEYMSPEQATRNQLDVDTRSDVYSLGVVLYELLTGETPLGRQRLHNAAWDEVLRIIREEEPPLASSKVSSNTKLPSVAANRRTEPAKLSALIRGELDWIAAKALEKDRARRYETASSFAEDVRRFLKNEQVLACPPTVAYRFKKYASRHWKLVVFSSLLLTAILLGLFGTLGQAMRAMKSEALAVQRADAEKKARKEEEKQRQAAENNRKEADNARRDSESRLARLYLERALKDLDSDPHSGLPWLVEAMRIEPASSPAAGAHRLRIQSMIQELPKLLAYLPARKPVFNRQNTQLAAVQDDKTVVLYALPACQLIATLKHKLPVKYCYFSPQGDFMLTVAGVEGGDRRARLWNTLDGQPLAADLDLTESEYSMKEIPTVQIAPNGERFTVLWAGMYNRWHSKVVAKVYDRSTLKAISPTFAHHSDLDMLYGYQILSQDGQRILLPRGLPASDKRAAWDDPEFPDDASAVQQYDLMSGKPVHNPLPQIQDFYDFPIYDSSSTKIATQAEGVIKIWNAADGALLREITVPPPVKSFQMIFHPNGKELIAIDGNRAILWNLEDEGDSIADWEHDKNFAIDKDFTQVIYKAANGISYRHIISRDSDENLQSRPLDDHGRAWFSDDGSKYILEGKFPSQRTDKEAVPSQVYDSVTGKPLTPPWKMSSTIFHDRLTSPGCRYLISINNGLLVWDLHDRQPFPLDFPSASSVKVVAADCNDSHTAIAILDSQRQLTVLNTNTGHLLYPALTVDNNLHRVQIFLSADAEHLIQLQDSKVLTLWDLKNGKSIWRDRTIRDSDHWIESIRFIDHSRSLCVIELVPDDTNASNAGSYKRNLYVEERTAPSLTAPKRTYGEDSNVDLVHYAGRDILMEIKSIPSENEFNREIHLVDPITLAELIAPLKVSNANQDNFAFTPDAQKIILGDGEVWDVKSSARLQSRKMEENTARVVVRASGDEFLLISEGGSARWSAAGRILRFSSEGRVLGSQMTSPSSGALAACYHPTQPILGTSTRGLRLWDMYTSAPITRDFELDGHRLSNCPIFFSPNGARLYTVGDKLTILDFEQLSKSVAADEILEAWARILSGKRVDALGSLVDLKHQEYEQSWKIIQDVKKVKT
jgi:serine/threonine protein kinase/WD40 repeat protein